MRIILKLAAVGLLVTTAAPAVTVSFGGKTRPTDSVTVVGPNGTATTSYLTMSTASRFTDLSNNGLGIEDFYGGAGVNGTDNPNPCSPTSTGLQGYSGEQSVGYYQDSVTNVRLQPKDGGTCYAVVNNSVQTAGPDVADLLPGAVTIAGFAGNGLTPLTYVGFLWGSPDSYNYIKFIDTNGQELSGLTITYNGNTLGANSTITGADVYNQFGFTADPGNAGTQFINLTFTAAENIGAIEIGNTGSCCFEFTNYSDSVDPVTDPGPVAPALANALAVSEPGAALALASGLGLLGLARRKRV